MPEASPAPSSVAPTAPAARPRGAVFRSLDGAFARLVAGAPELLVFPIFVGAMAGGGAYVWRHAEALPLLETNKLAQPDRMAMLVWCLVGVALVGLANLATVVARRVRTGSFDVVGAMADTQRRLAFLAALPLLGVLRIPKLETSWPKLSLLYILAAGALVAVSAYQLPALDGAPHDPERDADAPPGALARAGRWLARVAPPAGAVALWLGYGLLFTKLSIANHHSLNTRTTDLGFYDNIFYQSLHGKPLGCTFLKGGWHGSAHFDPILVLLSPLYALRPRAETILTLQSFWLGAGTVPIYLLARAKQLGRFAALALAGCYVAYPALHGVNMYEFHSLALINPLVLWLLYFFETGATRRYWLTLVALLLVREDIPLLLTFVSFYFVLSGKKHGPRTGWATMALSLAYFGLVKGLVMDNGVLAAGKDGYSFAYYYEELIPDKTSARQLVVSLLTNPTFALKLAFEDAKQLFLLQLLVPLAALPLLAKRGRIMMVYGLAFCLLASRDAVFTIHFQYASILIPVLFALSAFALGDLRERAPFGLQGPRVVRGLVAGMLVMSLAAGWRFGAPIENDAFRGGFSRIARSVTPEAARRYEWVTKTAQRIPADAALGISDRIGPHVSNRPWVYFYPDHTPLDFVFIDEGDLRTGRIEKHKKLVAAREVTEVARYGKMVLYRTKNSTRELLPPLPDTPDGPLPEAKSAKPDAKASAKPDAKPAPDKRKPNDDDDRPGDDDDRPDP